jgi:hypothetical protein
MKGMKGLFVVVAVFFAVSLCAGYANAAPGWFTCTVVETGASGTTNIVAKLKEAGGAFNKYMKGPVGRENQYLAIFLTAASSGLQVKVYVDPAAAGVPEITTIYLLNP